MEQFFFQDAVFLYFTKIAAAIHSSMDRVFLQEYLHSHELRIYNAFDRYLKVIELIRNLSCSHPLNE